MTMPPTAPPPAPVDQDEPWLKRWERFFKKYYRAAINEAALSTPKKRSLVVSYHAVHMQDPTLAEHLRHNPLQALAHADEALKSVDIPLDPRPRLHVRISMRHVNVEGSDDEPVLVEQPTVKPAADCEASIPPRTEHIGKLVTVRGRVMRVEQASQRVEDAIFQCARCGAFIREPQEEHLVLKEPLECYEEQGGCGRDTPFKFIDSETRGQVSRFVMVQRITLEQVYDEVRPGMNAAKEEIWLEDDLVDCVAPGEIVYVTGLVRVAPRQQGKAKSTLMKDFINASTIEKETPDSGRPTMTDEEQARLRGLLAQPDYLDQLVRICAPRVVGNDLAKRVLLLSLVGGMRSKAARHQIHVLLAGEPSTAKTSLARWFTKLAPRVVHVSGKDTSVPGLTVASVTEAGQAPYLAPGAFILGSGGLMLFDEMQDSHEDVRSALKEGMESQTITKMVAATPAHIEIDTIVWALINPPKGRFFTDGRETFLEQLELPPALQSRFDIILIFIDRRNPQRDGKIIESIVDRHWGLDPEDDSTPLVGETDDIAFLRKLVRLAAEKKEVRVPREVRRYAVELGVNIRNPQAQVKGSNASSATHRQVESLIRLAGAHAKLHLRDEMTREDVDAAAAIMGAWTAMALGDETDFDILNSGKSRDQMQLMRDVHDLLRERTAGADAIDEDELLGDFPRDLRERARRCLDELRRTGKAYCPTPGKWKV